MKTMVLIATILLGPLGAGMAMAGDKDCFVPMANWQPRDAVRKMAEARGWTVRRIKTDDGCYEIKGRDENGREIEAKVDPGSLAIVEVEYEDRKDRRRGAKNAAPAGTGNNAAPTGTVAPPDNGLFKNRSAPKVEVQ